MGNTPSVPYIKEQASAYKHKTTEELALLCSFVVRSAALLFIMCTWELNRTTFLTPDQGVRFRLWLSHASGTCTKTCISLFFFGLHKREVFHESAVSDYHFPFLTCRCVLPPVFSFTRQPRWAGKPGDVLWWSRDWSLAERRELETFSSWPLQQIQASSVGHSMHLFCISISVR